MSAFLDRADGELARIGNMMTPGGHRYDYVSVGPIRVARVAGSDPDRCQYRNHGHDDHHRCAPVALAEKVGAPEARRTRLLSCLFCREVRLQQIPATIQLSEIPESFETVLRTLGNTLLHRDVHSTSCES
jgi:hypothetical protein